MRGLLFFFLTFFFYPAAAQFDIVPQPQSMHPGKGIFEWTEQLEIVSKEPCVKEARLFAEWLSQATGKKFEVIPAETWQYHGPFLLFTSENAKSIEDMRGKVNDKFIELLEQSPQSSYTMSVTDRGVSVTATEPSGIFYATQTLKQMFTPGAFDRSLRLPYQMPCVMIRDQPRFLHRGMLLDCCRHFMSVDFIRRYIDLLAFYKMNVLHWHLTEDQGWRIQIEKYPRLTEVGAWRTNTDGSRYGGFYTQAQIREIVAYAEARHVTIIPEIEMPGHSVAAIASYPYLSCTQQPIEVENEWGVFKDIYCAGNDSTFQFLEDVLTEVCALFPGRYIHIGGDEAPKFRWENCPKCGHRMEVEGLQDEAELQKYFIERIAAFLEKKGKRIIGWDEILESGIPASAAIQSWRGTEGGMEAARHSHNVVMSPTSHCYFDYGLESIDLEKVYAFDPIPEGLESEFKRYILGAECNVWTERAPQSEVDDRVFPRMPALAEVLWSYNPNRQLIEFERRLKFHYQVWDRMNIRYGFAQIPVKFETKILDTSTLEISLLPASPDLGLSVRLNGETKETKYREPFRVTASGKMSVGVDSPSGKKAEKRFDLQWAVHRALGITPQLNYVPNRNYTGGGISALTDGVLGSDSFRDGRWQAEQGKNLEAVLKMPATEEIYEFSVRCFHYENAWIFRPEEVIVEVSDDGQTWKSWATIPATVELKTPGEFAVEFTYTSAQPVRAGYIRVTAQSIGPCPQWHDAVGEPSWIFWDEIVVRH